jgi:hypothetical protein
MEDHMHTMMHGDEASHTESGTTVNDAMKMMDMGQ